MKKILIPVDGSEHALRAAEFALELARGLKASPQMVLLNVQANVAKGNVKLFIDAQTIDDYQREQGMIALQAARQLLDMAQLSYQYHLSVGQPAEAITQFATTHDVSLIVMGAHGAGGLAKRLLGSVTAKVVEMSEVPVTVVR